MNKYYTRACNFYYGKTSKEYIKKKNSVPLNGSKEISFGSIEIFSRKKKLKVDIKDINKLPLNLKKKNKQRLKNIKEKKKIY